MIRESSDGKPRFDLLIFPNLEYQDQPLTRWAQMMADGAEKYPEKNFQDASSVKDYERFKESAFRHFMQWYCDEGDQDHMASLFFNVACAEYCLENIYLRDSCDYEPHFGESFGEPEAKDGNVDNIL